MASSRSLTHRRAHGQFFTEGNPFGFRPFQQWFASIPKPQGFRVLEPFAGANHLVRLMREAGYDVPWACFDVDPPAPSAEGIAVQRQDVLARFPKGFSTVITNPPYLARNSATRRGLPYPATPYDDLYKQALSQALAHTPYVAAIIPESFTVAGLFHDRLAATVALTSKMFQDTDCPVCLALFVPSGTTTPNDFELWDEEVYLGQYQDFAQTLGPVAEAHRIPWQFNAPQGLIGLRGVDDAKTASIRFVPGNDLKHVAIKGSSRSITRIDGVPADIAVDALIETANAALKAYRTHTHDTLLTAFKGLRADGKYRRRLDFAAARNVLDHCVQTLRTRSTP